MESSISLSKEHIPATKIQRESVEHCEFVSPNKP